MSQCPIRMEWAALHWHIRSNGSILNDIPFARLIEDIVKPLRAQEVVSIGGQRFTPMDNDIRIVGTAKRIEFYKAKLSEQCGQPLGGAADRLVDARYLPFIYEGEDCTDAMLYTDVLDVDVGPGCRSTVDVVLRLCSRLGETARRLGGRRTRPYVITDESDVRDLLHATLKAYCEDALTEESLPKVAGVTPSKADIAITSAGIAIETKLARGGQVDDAKIITSLSEKLTRYACWPHLRTLIYLVYDSARLHDPEALKRLFEREQTIGGRRFALRVVLA